MWVHGRPKRGAYFDIITNSICSTYFDLLTKEQQGSKKGIENNSMVIGKNVFRAKANAKDGQQANI